MSNNRFYLHFILENTIRNDHFNELKLLLHSQG